MAIGSMGVGRTLWDDAWARDIHKALYGIAAMLLVAFVENLTSQND